MTEMGSSTLLMPVLGLPASSFPWIQMAVHGIRSTVILTECVIRVRRARSALAVTIAQLLQIPPNPTPMGMELATLAIRPDERPYPRIVGRSSFSFQV